VNRCPSPPFGILLTVTRIHSLDIIGSQRNMRIRIKENDSTRAYYWRSQGDPHLSFVMSWIHSFIASWLWFIYNRSRGCFERPQTTTEGTIAFLLSVLFFTSFLRREKRKYRNSSNQGWRKKNSRLNKKSSLQRAGQSFIWHNSDLIMIRILLPVCSLEYFSARALTFYNSYHVPNVYI